jgi:pimeloyl-ACP methyl ester carboxylesterase
MLAFDAMTAAEDGTHDEDLAYMDAEMRIRFARDIRESLTNYDGIGHDNIAAGRKWDFDATAIRQPTFLWYGELDRSMMDHARWWQEQLPHAQLTLRPGNGHGGSYLLHWADMFRSLTT